MFWSAPKLPVRPAEQKWLEDRLQWLLQQFGTEQFLNRKTILPHISFFPEPFRGTHECVCKLVTRVCSYMDVDPGLIDVKFCFPSDVGATDSPSAGETTYSGAGGLFVPPTGANARMTVAISTAKLADSTSLVATIAHELGHVILLGGGRISRDEPDHEPLTDLVAVVFGMGIFTANASFQFSQWQENRRAGWHASRQGYLPEEMFAYALAACSWMKGETKPEWAPRLSINAGHFFKRSLKYLASGGQTTLVQLRT